MNLAAPTLTAQMKVPAAGAQREALRVKGQFWTPDWVADGMVAYALGEGAEKIFDPGVGAGAFFRAARRRPGPRIGLCGREVDPSALRAARTSGLSDHDLAAVELRDFVLDPPREKYAAITANPPYLRHHRLPAATKETLHAFARGLLGHAIDGRAGLHVFFLLHCLQALAPGGRLSFIVSADICEGVFARSLWQWIGARYRIEGVVCFSPAASPFPGIDTNAVLFLVQNTPPQVQFTWATMSVPDGPALTGWIERGCDETGPHGAIQATNRPLDEGLATGLSRAPSFAAPSRHVLGDFARVMRGIATGNNDFFFLTSRQVAELSLPARYFVPAIGRLRDVTSDHFTADDLRRLDSQGRPTLLLALDGAPIETLPAPLRAYLNAGERRGLPAATLIATRKPWYRMERREPPPFLFAYLGRRDVRFIRNTSRAVPLTCLLCVYPHDRSAQSLARLWRVLSDPRTLANLRLVGKSYGDGALKVEPRALQRLPLPDEALADAGLTSHVFAHQPELALSEKGQARYGTRAAGAAVRRGRATKPRSTEPRRNAGGVSSRKSKPGSSTRSAAAR